MVSRASSRLSRYLELVHTDSSFEPEESFFQLFSDPRSTRLTRVQLREDVVRDKDLEAIRKQVGCWVGETRPPETGDRDDSPLPLVLRASPVPL